MSFSTSVVQGVSSSSRPVESRRSRRAKPGQIEPGFQENFKPDEIRKTIRFEGSINLYLQGAVPTRPLPVRGYARQANLVYVRKIEVLIFVTGVDAGYYLFVVVESGQ
ncbi:hypothetical protein AVEN_102244-1 [Araneus ventricosus]|uniref:Uncharacterized protein n=1 Tax=Araneus ventricosus TaxID=182803 RepID=A0A4Y2WMV1_ARAVE|nr:hypothetical protein AVEN_102244-1 [Araneus ventricosus]